jgi:hypothetical protein
MTINKYWERKEERPKEKSILQHEYEHTWKFYREHRVYPFLRKYVGFPFIALLILAQAQLIIAAWAIEAKNIVTEVWANMDNTAYERTLVVEVEAPEDPAVIMEKIARCESGGTHYRKDGTLIKNVNNNGTIDFGKFQINSAWEAKAASMGMNIYLPEGNEAFAYWLYDTRGTEDWYSSKHCWK